MPACPGRVLDVRPGFARVIVSRRAACAGCQGACGVPLLADIFGGGSPAIIEIPIPNGASLAPGERVQLAYGADALLRAAGLAYGFPIVGLMGGALLGAVAGSPAGDALVMTAGLAGLTAGWLAGRRLWRIRGRRPVLHPLGGRVVDA